MEIFKQLKELGYKHYIDLTIEELDNLPINNIERRIECSLVIDWFREKYNYHIEIHFGKDKSSVWFDPIIYTLKKPRDGYAEDDWLYEPLNEVEQENTFYKAREQAILKALELITNK